MRRGQRQRERGQTATEYLLVVSVAVLSLVGAAYTFVPSFRDGVRSLSQDVQATLASHELTIAGRHAAPTARRPGNTSGSRTTQPGNDSGSRGADSNPGTSVPGDVVVCGGYGCVVSR